MTYKELAEYWRKEAKLLKKGTEHNYDSEYIDYATIKLETLEECADNLEGIMIDEKEKIKEALRLLGWAEFNLTKGKRSSVLTLIQKAKRELDE